MIHLPVMEPARYLYLRAIGEAFAAMSDARRLRGPGGKRRLAVRRAARACARAYLAALEVYGEGSTTKRWGRRLDRWRASVERIKRQRRALAMAKRRGAREAQIGRALRAAKGKR